MVCRLRRSGFTLIELLVVLAVIVVLAAIIFPVYSSVQKKASEASCLSNLHSIGLAMKLYRNEYKRYPNAALDPTWNSLAGAGLKDDTGQAAFTGAAYNTAANGRKTRINALYPNYLESQKALICPDEEQDSLLIAGVDGASSLNGQDPVVVLDVGGDGSASTYDDLYNAFGYNNTALGDVSAPGVPIVSKANELAGGRKSPRLNNPYAPSNTIITVCREHDEGSSNGVSLIVRVDGATDKVVRSAFNWATQAETGSN
ncbi:MAG: prepilin-type N-terminal cleavage/methylation domain-containing protein [Fimbriimonadaceae bacterium]|nr:prepilin-type N-terminal cleavage/methylation domain-containing protein [Fimbriimonadaceae bacterium]